jgi:hypothetical protein
VISCADTHYYTSRGEEIRVYLNVFFVVLPFFPQHVTKCNL